MDDFVAEPVGSGKIKLSVQAQGTIVFIEIRLDQVSAVIEEILRASETSRSWIEGGG